MRNAFSTLVEAEDAVSDGNIGEVLKTGTFQKKSTAKAEVKARKKEEGLLEKENVRLQKELSDVRGQMQMMVSNDMREKKNEDDKNQTTPRSARRKPKNFTLRGTKKQKAFVFCS